MASPSSTDATPASTIAPHHTGDSTINNGLSAPSTIAPSSPASAFPSPNTGGSTVNHASASTPTIASGVTRAQPTVGRITSPPSTARTATPPIRAPFTSTATATATATATPLQVYDGHEHVDVFQSILHHHVWYTIKAVRVNFVYKDIHNHHLQLFLIDKNGDTIAAVVPRSLIHIYEHLDLVGGVFSIHHFQMEGRGNDDFPRYGSYSLHRNEWEIVFNKYTKVTRLTDAIPYGIPIYPKVATLKALADDVTLRRMIVDVVGRVTDGRLIRYTHPYYPCRVGYCELSLQDSTGQVMKLILHHTSDTLPGMLARAKRDKMIVYVSRVKLIHRKPANLLLSNDLTKIDFDPDISL